MPPDDLAVRRLLIVMGNQEAKLSDLHWADAALKIFPHLSEAEGRFRLLKHRNGYADVVGFLTESDFIFMRDGAESTRVIE